MKGAGEARDKDGWMEEGVREQTENRLREDVEIAARKREGRMEGRETDWVERKKGRRTPERCNTQRERETAWQT